MNDETLETIDLEALESVAGGGRIGRKIKSFFKKVFDGLIYKSPTDDSPYGELDQA